MHLGSAKPAVKTRFFYGWIIVGVAALSVFFSGPGQTYSISIYINAYIDDFGWSRTYVSSLYSAATILSGALLFIIGRMIDRYGLRRMSVVVSCLLALACLWNSIIVNPAMLFLGFFLLRYFGQGSMMIIPSTLVPQWFIKKRALAFSIMSTGGATGAVMIPLINNWLIQSYSWSFAWQAWAVIILVIFVPLAFVFLRNSPESAGLLPDGANDKYSNLKDQGRQIQEVSWTLAEAIKTRSFWLMIFCLSVPSMVNTGLIFHIVSILSGKGINTAKASVVISVMALVAFPCSLAAGYILDKVNIRYVLAATAAIQIGTMFILVSIKSFEAALAFAAVRGLIQGFEIITGNIVWPNYYGRRHLGSIRSFIIIFFVVASALGPLPFGAAFDYFGGYDQIIYIMMLFPLLGIGAALMAVKPNKFAPGKKRKLKDI